MHGLPYRLGFTESGGEGGADEPVWWITEAAVDAPGGGLREVVFPAAGGMGTLMDLVAESN